MRTTGGLAPIIDLHPTQTRAPSHRHNGPASAALAGPARRSLSKPELPIRRRPHATRGKGVGYAPRLDQQPTSRLGETGMLPPRTRYRPVAWLPSKLCAQAPAVLYLLRRDPKTPVRHSEEDAM